MAELDRYKQAIVEEYRSTNRNIFVSATAGSGKTFTLCKLAEMTPPIKSSIFLAFNKSIAEELSNRLPRMTKASTLHSYSLSALCKAFSLDFRLNDSKNFSLAKEKMDFKGIHPKRIPGIIMKVCKLYDLMRFNLVPDNIEAVIALGERYGEEADEELAKRAIELRSLNLRIADNYFLNNGGGKLPIDFTDMLYYATRYIDIKDFKQYNVVMLDECLPYKIPVICENGQHLPIGKIVEEKLPVKVLTFNHETGEQEYKRVTNFSRTFNTKRCVKINAVQRKKHGERSFITCTFNHKIWVKDKGYIYAEEVQVGDIIQYETSAVKTQKYRVSSAGKHTGIDCPIYLEVTNVTDMLLNEKYVYDITVEDNHNFYANGILVHNCQDISPLQYEIVKKCRTPRGRLVAVGDQKQSIYAFMGSNLDSLHAIKNSPNTIELPLSMTYRCAESIVDEACKVFPDGIVAAPGASKGLVGNGTIHEAREGDFILCRNNAPLADAFISLIRNGKKCSIIGKEFGNQLVSLIDSVDDIFDLEKILLDLEEKLSKKGLKNPTKTEAYDKVNEKVNVLLSLYEYFGSLDKVRSVIYDIFVENASRGIILSTIHKSKGLEADRVFFLEPGLIPSKYAVTELAMYAEKCLKFVGITRARKELIYC